MNRTKSVRECDFAPIKPNDSIESVFGPPEERSYSVTDARWIEFQKKIREVFDVARGKGVQEGEILLMVTCWSKGRFFDKVEFCEFPELLSFVKNNIDRYYSIIDPELHVKVMQYEYYSRNPVNCATKDVVAKTASTLVEMVNNKRSVADFDDFGIRLAKHIYQSVD